MTIIDCSFGYPTATEILDAGHTGLIGYVSDYRNKNLPRAVVEDCSAKGVPVNTVWENGKNDLLFGSNAQQVAAGGRCKAQNDALGKPMTAIDWVTVDTDAAASTWPTIANNVDRFHQGSVRPIGFYGPMELGEILLRDSHVSALWVPYAWGDNPDGSGASIAEARAAGAALYQRLQAATVGGHNVDVNDVLSTKWGGWVLPGSTGTQGVAPTVSGVAFSAPVVDVLTTRDGCWMLHADGGVEAHLGAFHGSYESLPANERQDTAPFVAITTRPNGAVGYTLWNTLGHSFDFGG